VSEDAGAYRAPVIYAEVPGFYAAVARADDPVLRRAPVIVGGDPQKRGRVQSASPDALERGVYVGMSMVDALGHCPDAHLIRTDMNRYRAVSKRLMGLIRGFDENLETDHLNAAYLVYEDSARSGALLDERAAELCRIVREELDLPLRVGIASVKFLARLAAEEVREAGVLRIAPEEEDAFLGALPPTRLPLVGPKAAAALRDLGVRSVADLLSLGEDRIVREIGPHGRRILAFAKGEDTSPIRVARHPKSLSHATTFAAPELERAELERQLQCVCEQVEEDLREQGLNAGKIALQVLYEERKPETRSRKLVRPILTAADVYAAAVRLLDRTEAGSRPIRRVGVTLADLSPALSPDPQLDLFA
jgi:DNA polymerase-4